MNTNIIGMNRTLIMDDTVKAAASSPSACAIEYSQLAYLEKKSAANKAQSMRAVREI